MTAIFIKTPAHLHLLLKNIEDNPSDKNVNKCIKKIIQVRNKSGCLSIFRKKKQVFLDPKYMFRSLITVKVRTESLSSSSIRNIEKAMQKSKQLYDITKIKTGRPITDKHYNCQEFIKESIKKYNIDTLNQKVPFSAYHGPTSGLNVNMSLYDTINVDQPKDRAEDKAANTLRHSFYKTYKDSEGLPYTRF